MSPELREELAAALRNNDGQLGKVFALLEGGAVSNRDLVEGGAAANQGAAANLRVTVKAVLDGLIPAAPSVAAQSGRSIGGLLKDNPNLSPAARMHLERLRGELDAIATNTKAIEAEDKDLERQSKVLEKSLENLPGVYVYTLPSFLRVVQKADPERFWFKVGMTERVAGVRIGEQMRATGLPEDPVIARVYRHAVRSPREIEADFRRLLEAAGHSRAPGRHAGVEWYATNLGFVDVIAAVLGCEIAANDLDDE